CAKHAECDPRSLLADRLEMRFHLIRPELVDRAGYCKVFFVQIFGRENFVGRAILNEERAAFNLKRSCRDSCHHLPRSRSIATPHEQIWDRDADIPIFRGRSSQTRRFTWSVLIDKPR